MTILSTRRRQFWFVVTVCMVAFSGFVFGAWAIFQASRNSRDARRDMCVQIQASNRGSHQLWKHLIARSRANGIPSRQERAQISALEHDLDRYFPIKPC